MQEFENLMSVLSLFALYVVYGSIFRILLSWVLPKKLLEGADELILKVRNSIIDVIEGLWPDRKNAEVVILSRLIAPFVVMLLLEVAIVLLMVEYVQFYALYLMFSFLRLLIFMNVAPSIDDWRLIFDSSGPSKLAFITKSVLIITLIGQYELAGEYLIDGISNAIVLISGICLPLSSWNTISGEM